MSFSFSKPVIKTRSFSPLAKHSMHKKKWEWMLCEPYSGDVLKRGSVFGSKDDAKRVAKEMARGMKL